MDTDGSCTKNGNAVFSTSSSGLRDDIIEIIQSLGGIATYTQQIPKLNGTNHRLSYKVYVNLPKEYNPFRLKRKADIYKPNMRYIPRRYIVDVQEDGFELCQCISVDNPSHLYITDDYIVTHNTYTAVFAALSLLSRGDIEKIFYVRSAVESASRSLGFLPGELEEKFQPWLIPLLDKMEELVDPLTQGRLLGEKYLEAAPINYWRGRTAKN